MYSIRQVLLVSFFSFTFAKSVDNGFDDDLSSKKKILRYRQTAIDAEWDDSVDEYLYGNETTVSPAPSVSPSLNATTISPSPSVAPTPSPSERTISPTTLSPTTAPPSPTHHPHHPHHEGWKYLWKFVLKTVFWMFIAGLFFFAFGAVMSNRYRIYYYLRGSWYSLLQKLKWSRRSGRDGSAPSSTLNDIIFSDNDLQEGLLMRET